MMDTASLDANSTLPCHYYLNLETAGDGWNMHGPHNIIENIVFSNITVVFCYILPK